MERFEVLFGLAERRSQAELHYIHASSKHHGGKDGIGKLMKCRVLEIVVVQCNENRQGNQSQGKDEAILPGLGIGKGCIIHEACSVDHAQFIDELHGIYGELSIHGLVQASGWLTLERCVEQKASRSDE